MQTYAQRTTDQPHERARVRERERERERDGYKEISIGAKRSGKEKDTYHIHYYHI